MTLNWKSNEYFSLLLHRDKRSHAALEMLVDDLHADKGQSISRFLCHSGSEDFLWGLVRLLGNTNSRVAGNAAYILGTLAESELGCYRVISLTSSLSREGTQILTDLTNMLTFDDSESVMNAAGTMGTLAESHEGRMWMLNESCIMTTLTHVTALLTNDNLWTASNAALVLARLTIAEEGCQKLLIHKDADHILSCLVNALGVDEAGRGMNAAFAIGRLCDMEWGRNRLLQLSESEKMISALARMLCCSDTGASKNACFALSCLATDKDGHTRLLKNAHSEEVLKTLAELLSAEDTETAWFAAMTLRTLASQPRGCLRLRDHPSILPALKEVEGRSDVGEDLREEVSQTMEILKKLDKCPAPTVEVLGPNEISVTWTEVTTKSGFTVKYQLLEDTKCVYQGGELTFTLGGLLPYTQYSFRVRAVAEGDDGPLSEVVNVITDEDVPGPIQNLRVLGFTTTQLKVGWDPPESMNGVLRGYTVYVGKNSEHTHDLSHIITGLTPCTTYQVQVCAATSKGKGPKESVSGTTSELGAHAPSKPEVLVRGRNELHVAWKAPEVPLGRISRYDLLLDGEAVYSGTELHYTVHRLRPDTEYALQVVAITNEGRCESKTTKRRTAKDGFEGDRAPLYQPPVRKDPEPDQPKPTHLLKKRKSVGSILSSYNPDPTGARSAPGRCTSASSVKSRRREKISHGELPAEATRGSKSEVHQPPETETADNSKDNNGQEPEHFEITRVRSYSAKSRSSRTSEGSELNIGRSATFVAKEPLPKPKRYDIITRSKGPSRNNTHQRSNVSRQNDNVQIRKSMSRTKPTENVKPQNGMSEKKSTPRAIANVAHELLDLSQGSVSQHASGTSREPSGDVNHQLDRRMSTSEPDNKWMMQSKSRAEQDLAQTFHSTLQLTGYRDHYKPALSQPGPRGSGIIELGAVLPQPPPGQTAAKTASRTAPAPIQRAHTMITAHRPGMKKQLEKLTVSRTPPSHHWRPDFPSNPHVERTHNKFVPMQLRTQPANLPTTLHRQVSAINVDKAQSMIRLDLVPRQRTEIDLRNRVYMYGPSYHDNEERPNVVPTNHRDRIHSGRSSASLSLEPPVTPGNSTSPTSTRHQAAGAHTLSPSLALSPPASTETKLQSAR